MQIYLLDIFFNVEQNNFNVKQYEQFMKKGHSGLINLSAIHVKIISLL